jgi:glyoxylase-like metal-dependent hydrolase (beta-lactamase superfamily II)/rhodanese-related sulfurtransferase
MTSDSVIPRPLPETVDAETLRQWIDGGADITVLDVRPQKERADWSIPGSIHVDAYQALRAGDPHALDPVPLRAGKPVVTVCAAGRTSRIASALLRARGVAACSLEGGMKAWSGAWNTADAPARRGDTRIVQVRRTGKGCISYVIGTDGDAVVIDASVHPDVYLGIARDNGWRISSVIETHVHADHVSRARVLSLAVGARLFLPAQGRASYEHVSVNDGDVLPLGASPDRLVAIRTPGHTAESTCYLLDGSILFTGDTLFLQGVGRPDLEAGPAQAEARAGDLFHSLKRLRGMPRETLVLPAHASAPVAFDRIPLCATLAQLETRNGMLTMDQVPFISTVLDGIPATPPNFLRIIELNEAGRMPESDLLDLEAGSNRCAVG